MDVDHLLVLAALTVRRTHSAWQIFTYQPCESTYIRARRGRYTVMVADLDALDRAFASYERERSMGCSPTFSTESGTIQIVANDPDELNQMLIDDWEASIESSAARQ